MEKTEKENVFAEIDVDSLIGPMDSGAEFEMFSYRTPVQIFWQSFYEGLRETGHSHKNALETMQSVFVRHMFDGRYHQLAALAKQFAAELGQKCARPTFGPDDITAPCMNEAGHEGFCNTGR